VKAGWYQDQPTSNVSITSPDTDPGLLSPTPVPVVANWFDNLENKLTKNINKEEKNEGDLRTSIRAATSDLDEILDELIVADLELGLKQSTAESKNKLFLTDDADNVSVRSDVTVIEKAPEVQVDDSSLRAVPQSPKEIRKKFQTASSFEKDFVKSSDIELSQEFKQGIKGKVKASKENFLKQISSDQNQNTNVEKRTQQTKSELQQIKLHRAASRDNIEECRHDIDNSLKQEKLMELEAVKRSRSKSRVRDDQIEQEFIQNSYLQEKRERDMELMLIANRKVNMSWEPQIIRVKQEKVEEKVDEQSSLMIQEMEDVGEDSFDDREDVDDMSDLERSQLIWNERAEELKQMANMRPKSPWRSQQESDSCPEIKNKIRTTAAAWRDREKSASRDRDSPSVSYDKQMMKDVPTRRIGSLFNKDPDYWNLNDNVDDLPEPPSSPTPPTPVRQSSRGKIEEYARDSNKASQWGNC